MVITILSYIKKKHFNILDIMYSKKYVIQESIVDEGKTNLRN